MFSNMGFWSTTKIGVIMKTALQIIKDMVKKYPNDMELGARIREYIRTLFRGDKNDV